MAKRRSSRKLTYREQLEKKIKAAWKKHEKAYTSGDAWEARLEAIYYTENLGGVACASWKKFRDSWAGKDWVRRQELKDNGRA
jgi:hypothetical protein